MIAVVAVFAALLGPGRAPGAGTDDRIVAPALRLVDLVTRGAAGQLRRGHPVTIADETRRALTAPAALHLALRRSPAGARQLELPPGLADASWLVLEAATARPGDGERHPSSVAAVRPLPGTRAIPLPSDIAGPGRDGPAAVWAWRMPDLHYRDVLLGPVGVPPDATLEFARGVEERAWGLDTGALEFRVTLASDGTESAVFTARVDPRRPEDRRWVDERVDLRPFAGRAVRIRFSVRRADPATTGSSLPVWGEPVIVAPARAPRPPGVLLVSLDTLRARSVGVYGAERPTTPRLDALATEGVLFEDASAPAPQTLDSHMSLLTGLYARSHRVDYGKPVAARHPLLAEALRAAGFATAAFTENGLILPNVGFQRGFDVYHENRALTARARGEAHETFARGIAWLRRHADRPFFLFLHTYEVHTPYRPRPGYATLYATADPAEPVEAMRLAYEREVRCADDEVAALLGELDALGVADRTLVIVTADHGEEFGEHGGLFHGAQLWDEVVRVPLLVRWPGALPAGHRVAAPVSLVDVVPTVLDLLGLPIPAGLDGTSLVAPLLGGDAAPPRAGVLTEARPLPGAAMGDVAARTAAWMCIRTGRTGAIRCFDRRADPDEQAALAPDHPGARDAVELLAGHVARGPSGVGQLTPPEHAADDRLQKLRELGYVE